MNKKENRGGANRNQGRHEGSINKKGIFTTSLPPVRCSQELKEQVEAQTITDGKKSPSEWIRTHLEQFFGLVENIRDNPPKALCNRPAVECGDGTHHKIVFRTLRIDTEGFS